MHLVGFTIEIYYDARPYEHQTVRQFSPTDRLKNCLYNGPTIRNIRLGTSTATATATATVIPLGCRLPTKSVPNAFPSISHLNYQNTPKRAVPTIAPVFVEFCSM